MSDYAKITKSLRCGNIGDDECGFSDCPYWSNLGCMDGILCEDAAAAIEELTAQVKDKDYLIQQQVDEIERLRRDVKKQQEKMIELAKGLYKTGVFAADGREIMKGDKVKGLFWLNSEITGTVIFRNGSFGLEWDRGGSMEFTPFTSTCNVNWKRFEKN